MVGTSPPGPAAFEAAGLYDPAAPGATERLALLEYLVGLGATIDDLLAVGPGELPVVASMIALRGTGTLLTLAEVAARAGLDELLLRRVWRSVGLPDPPADAAVFSTGDLDLLATLEAGRTFLGEEVTMQLMRVLGTAAARVADAAVSAFMVNVLPAAIERDPSGLELARANATGMEMLDALERAFGTMLRRHLLLGFRPLEPLSDVPGVDVVRRTVVFADLVESTAWAARVDVATLGRALATFDALASEIVVPHGGRVVKVIGDEVMVVASQPVGAVVAALELVDALRAHDLLPPVRVGIATGDAVARGGDYTGTVVNLAARAVKLAEPSGVVVDEATAAALAGDRSLVCGEPRVAVLKGFDEPVALTPVNWRDATSPAR